METSVNPDGTEFASVGYDGQLLLWDMANSVATARYPLGSEQIYSIAVDWTNRLDQPTGPIGMPSSVRGVACDLST